VDTIRAGRPAFVSRRLLLETVTAGDWRRVWSLGGTVTAVERSDWTICRAKEEWGPPAELERAIAWWLGRGLKAASPTGVVLQAARDWFRPLAWSRHGFAAGHVRGGWEETTVRGTLPGPHHVYDIRRAYRWALTAAPLPKRETIQVAVRWLPDRPGLHLVDIAEADGAPWPIAKGGKVLIETPIDCTGLVVKSWHGGVVWTETIGAQPLGELLDGIGASACQRSYWGMWAASLPSKCQHASGAVTWLKPYGADYVRAHLITARVRRRLAEVQAPYRYVDMVITTPDHAPPVGPNVGDFREVKRYDDGVWIGYPGAYGPAGGRPDRLAGVQRSA
jgi:hypothetical protein